MPPPRRFDHDAARALLAAGFYQKDVAAMLGVSGHSIWRIASEKNRINTSERAKTRWRGTCSKCGGPCVSETHPAKRKRPTPPRALCQKCLGISRRQRFRFDELGQVAAVKCETCKEFKHPEAFGAGIKFRDVRPQGFHSCCRACLTKLRQDYRERHKVPCDRCGNPRLPAGEKGGRAKKDSGLCKACYQESRRAA